MDKQGRLIFFCSSSSLGGLTIERLQTVLLSKGIECHEALNLDGGGSAQMFLGQVSGVKRSPEQDQDRPIFDLPGGDEVPVVLALILNGQ